MPGEKAAPAGRPRLGGEGRRPRQHRLNAETVDKKLAVLEMLERTSCMRTTINNFYPHLSPAAYKSKYAQIYAWKKVKATLAAAAAENKGSMHKLRARGVATALSPEEESEIVRFVNELREDGVPVSTLILCTKAKEVAEDAGVHPFSASPCWVDGFKARHTFSISAATRQCQRSPHDLDRLASAFVTEVESTIRELGSRASTTLIKLVRVHSLCEDVARATRLTVLSVSVACFFEYLPTRTLAKTGEKTIWVKCGGATKDRATVMLLGDSTGTRYAPFVVFKAAPSRSSEKAAENTLERCGLGSQVWREVKALRGELNIEIHGNKKGV